MPLVARQARSDFEFVALVALTTSLVAMSIDTMLPALGTIDRVPTIDGIAGNWAIQRPEGTQPICALKLSADKDGDGTTKLSPNGDCAPEIKDMKLVWWALEGFGIVLMSDDGTTLSFDMKADGTFDRSLEDGGKPLKLVRQP